MTVSKLAEFAIFKKPKFFVSGQYLPQQKSQRNLVVYPRPPSFVVYTLKKTAFRVNYEQHEPTKRAKSVQLKKYPYVVFYIATAEGLFINCVDRILTPSPIVNNFTT